ncbi:hypothetical protein C8F01DRAFT_441104 [Mycena amicta]|nr:hypothetical protein C8F01DRAFT_441104 [Mycena amicta]
MSAPGSTDFDFVAPALQLLEGPFNLNVAPGSRYHMLLTTNEPPDTSDVALIEEAMLKSDARLAFLDKEISRLVDSNMPKSGSHSTFFDSDSSKLMVKWEEERVSLLDYRAQNKAVISSLRRIPPEVLGEIFSLTLPVRVQDTAFSTIRDSPWVLTHICKRWREIAVSTPSLWSRVATDYFKKRKFSIPMIETQIQRAKLLRVYFWPRGSWNEHQTQVFQLLAEHSARWEQFTIGVTKYMLPLLATLRGSLPALRKGWIQWSEYETQRETLDFFEIAPSLRDVIIYNHNPTPIQVRVLLPSQQLTRYGADGPWTMHRDVLRFAPNLVELRLETSESAPFAGDSGEIIELLHLRRLYVSTVDVLDYIKAPALEEIAFHLGSELNVWRNGAADDDSGDVDLILHLDPFVNRSLCTLRRLILLGSPHAHRFSEILRQYPSIVSLATLTSNPRVIISCLTVPNATADATLLSPQLSEIEIGSQFPIKWGAYIAMLESRWKMEGCALRSARTAFVNSRPNGARRAKLDALRKEGLNISLVEGEKDASNLMNQWIYALQLD